MKVAELFAEIGFKVEGADQLKSFEASLQNIAVAARNAALAMKVLARTQVPRNLITAANRPANAPGTAANPVVVQPATPGALPPPIPGGAAPAGNTAVNQGFKSLTTFAKQLVGFGSLAYVLKSLISGMASAAKASLAASFSLDQLTEQTGMSRDEIQRWNQAATDAGLQPQEMQDQLAKLAAQTAGMQLGQHQGEAATMARFGINPSGRPQDILQQFGQRMSTETLANAQMLGGLMGIGPQAAYAMWRNQGNLPSIPTGVGLSKEQQDARLAAAKAVGRLGVETDNLKDHITANLSTWWRDVLNDLSDGLRGFVLQMQARRTGDAGAYMNWLENPLPGSSRHGVIHQTNVGETTVTNNIGGVSDPNRAAKVLERALTNASYQRAPTWNGPVPAPQ